MIHFIHSIIGFLLVQSAYAAGVSAGDSAWQKYKTTFGGTDTGVNFIHQWAARIGNFTLTLVSGGAVIAIMWGGIKMITSAGNDEGKESAKKIILYAVGGLLLAIMSKSIIDFTRDFTNSFTPNV